MGHGKLIKFAENETFRCLVQPDPARLLALKTDPHGPLVLADHPLKGNWNAEMFAKPQPLVVELGCGKGEYTIDLSRRNPDFNYIGVDIKGARLWKGAKEAETAALPNVAFLRTRVEFLPALFAPGEVSEIWLTFSDPPGAVPHLPAPRRHPPPENRQPLPARIQQGRGRAERLDGTGLHR